VKKAPGELFLIRPAIFGDIPEVVALQSTRQGGFSNPPYDSLNLGRNTADDAGQVARNLELLGAALGMPPAHIIFTEQVHGTRVVRVDGPGNVSNCDALITDTAGIFPAILTADCYPVLIHDPEHRASGAAHAGWQGTAGRIVQVMLKAMTEAFGTRPEACLAWVGTGISGDRYEVGGEVAAKFDTSYLLPSPGGDGRYLLDLSAANRDQLLDAGIPANHVACSSWCSSRDRELFFSYRRDNGQTGRMASLIGVRASA
jgi:polyphenol oxidase